MRLSSPLSEQTEIDVPLNDIKLKVYGGIYLLDTDTDTDIN